MNVRGSIVVTDHVPDARKAPDVARLEESFRCHTIVRAHTIHIYISCRDVGAQHNTDGGHWHGGRTIDMDNIFNLPRESADTEVF